MQESNGTGTKYNAVGAWRPMFTVAVKDRHLATAFDPSPQVGEPQRIDGTRIAFEQYQMDELWAVARS